MRRLVGFFCLFWTLYLHSQEEQIGLIPSTPEQISSFFTQEPRFLIGGYVHPLSGTLCLHATDLIARGAQDVKLQRVYLSPSLCPPPNKHSEIGGFLKEREFYYSMLKNSCGWEFLPYLQLEYNGFEAKIPDANGAIYVFQRNELVSPYAISNLSGDTPSALADPRNIRFAVEKEQIKVFLPNGTTREYSAYERVYLLQREILPNGKVLRYTYQSGQIKRIESFDLQERYLYASIEFEGSIFENHFRYDSHTTGHPCGKYEYPKGRADLYATGIPFFVISKAKTHAGAVATFAYQPNARSKKLKKKCGTFSYKMQLSPSLIASSTPSFRDEKIAYDSFLPHSVSNKEGIIACTYMGTPLRIQTLQLPVGERGAFSSAYSIDYDPPIPGQKEGSTTATHPDGAQTIYRFNKNLLLSAIENWFEGSLINQKTYTYDDKQHIQKIEMKDARGVQLQAKYYECDAAGNPLIEKIEGDGQIFTIQRIYSENRLIHERHDDGREYVCTYLGDTHLPTLETTLANHHLLRQTTYIYDDAYNLIEEAEVGKTRTRYNLYLRAPHLHRIEWEEKRDWNHQLIYKIHYAYDQWGNTSQEDHYGSDGQFAYSIRKTYDEQGNLLQETNPLNQTASYRYDSRGRCVHEDPFSKRLSIDWTFDARGRLILLQEGDHSTRFAYNASDELIEKTDYLGLATTYTYDPVHGKLTCIDAPPTLTSITYDSFGREKERSNAYVALTKTKRNCRGDPLEILHPEGGKEIFSYAPNGNLLTHIDPDGLKTTYTYDPLGRVLTKTIGDQTTTYRYDAHHLIEEIDPARFSTQYRYDLAGRQIEKTREARTSYFGYDSLGHLAFEKKGDRQITYCNDLLGRKLQKWIDNLLLTTWTYDPAGNIASIDKGGTRTFAFDPYNRLIEKVDPEGNKIQICYEEADQILRKVTCDPRGIETVETYNPHALLLKKEVAGQTAAAYSYDRALRLLSQDHLTFTYTPDGNRASFTESSLRTTRYAYTSGGKLLTKQKPDGTLLYYQYDSQGRLVRVNNRTFQYDSLDRLIQGTGFSREWDPFGNVLCEQFDHGLWLKSTYDDWNRPLERIFPDQSRITYQYEGPFLKKIIRCDADDNELYTHIYNQYDARGNPLSETGLFTTTYTYDLLGRKILQQSPYFTESIAYDPAGNLIRKGDIRYTYDSLSQMTSESGHFTARYDVHYNPIELNNTPISLDSCNQLLQADYDPNGNLLRPGFTYDCFDQLICTPDQTYTYDALGRRLQKGSTSYLYLGEEEIGSFEGGRPKELKILALDGPIALEIDGKPYYPIADVQGTLRLLIDPNTSKVCLENSCDPFGVGLSSEIPYAYAGKRYDAQAGLIYFGKRYYVPALRRWLTPDPIGPVDHSNLYQYVFNNPYCFHDPNGESIGGYLLGLGEIILGGTLIFTGGVLEIATLGGYTIGCGFQIGAGMTLIGDGLIRTTNEARDVSFPNFINKNSSFISFPGNNSSKQRKKTSRNRLEPNERAVADHSVFRKDTDGRVVKYETFRPQMNKYDPRPWESVKRYDGLGSKPHFDKFSEQYIDAPHVHDPYCPGGIRPASPWEIPE